MAWGDGNYPHCPSLGSLTGGQKKCVKSVVDGTECTAKDPVEGPEDMEQLRGDYLNMKEHQLGSCKGTNWQEQIEEVPSGGTVRNEAATPMLVNEVKIKYVTYPTT